MSNKHRKRADPPTIEQFMQRKMREIQSLFTRPMRVTIVVRYPPDPDAEIVFSDDDFDNVIKVMQRRRDAVVASQEAAKSEPSADPRQQQGE